MTVQPRWPCRTTPLLVQKRHWYLHRDVLIARLLRRQGAKTKARFRPSVATARPPRRRAERPRYNDKAGMPPLFCSAGRVTGPATLTVLPPLLVDYVAILLCFPRCTGRAPLVVPLVPSHSSCYRSVSPIPPTWQCRRRATLAVSPSPSARGHVDHAPRRYPWSHHAGHDANPPCWSRPTGPGP